MSDYNSNDAYGDLVRESLHNLLPATIVITWLWTAFVAIFIEGKLLPTWGIFAVICAAAGLSRYLSPRHLRLSAATYLLGLMAAVACTTLVLHDRETYYLYMLVVLIAAILTNPSILWGLSLLCIVMAYVTAFAIGNARVDDLFVPSLFILATAAIAQLSTRRLFMALDWALSMTEEAQKNAQEAQKHRGEVQRMLKSLDEAYVRLERANTALLLARETAEKAYEFKATFVANVSHELRMPLNLIVGFSEMMATAPESYGGVQMPREYRADIMAIYRSARHLTELINDVLDLSQIETGRLPLDRELENLPAVVCEAVDIMRGLAEARRLRLEIDLPGDLPPLRLDRTRIRQVLLNLLTNAARFTDVGWIRVHACLLDREVAVSIQDSGRGIPPDKLAKAFEVFSQLHENPEHEGSGLGLALSKKFIELHGGRIWIESAVGHGTTVWFTLPVPRDEPESIGSPLVRTAMLSPTSSPVVALLHDDPRTMSLLRRYIEGFQFVLADTAEQLHHMLLQTLPLAVLMDGEWLRARGIGAVESELPANIPFISCPLPGRQRLASKLGAIDYLTKPITRDNLQGAMARLSHIPQRVLVVDDDPHIVLLLSRMLKTFNPTMQVFEAFGGRQALEITRLQRPELVLLDLLMPEMSGYEFLQEITCDKATASTPVIIVSAHGVEEETVPINGELRIGRETGFSTTEILQVVQALLNALTRPVAAVPTSVEAPAEVQPG